MRSTSIDILIPTRNDVTGATRVVNEALRMSSQHQVRVLVSVSDPNSWSNVQASVAHLDPRIQVLPEGGDLSLYGNFRRLINAAEGEWLVICADDDSRVAGALDEYLQFAHDDCAVVIPPLETRVLDRQVHEFRDRVELKPPVVAGLNRTFRAENANPNWIFSLWRTEWIQSTFAQEDFDWLDLAVVQKAVYEGRYCVAADATPTILGTVPGRAPWAVSTDGLHSSSGWESYTRSNVASPLLLGQLLWRFGPVRRIRKTQRRLNKRVKQALNV